MKRLYFLLLPLLATSLFGCNHNDINPISPNEGNQEQEEEQQEETPKITEWKYSLDFSNCGFEDGSSFDETRLAITDSISFNFLVKGTGDKKTKYYEPSVRFYSGNKFSITSTQYDLKRIEFTFEDGEKNNEISVSAGSFSNTNWTGLSKDIEFTICGDGGHRRISIIDVFFDKEGIQPEEEIVPDPSLEDLGEKSISEVKKYIKDNPIQLNQSKIGVNNKVLVTIKGFALAKLDLVKNKKEYGLNVSYSNKVILADSTGYIGVATPFSKDGTTLYGKIGDNVMKEDSKYIVTGYISTYLNQPELVVTSFSWDKTLNITWNKNVISDAEKTISEFYTETNNTYYNCAGHGYGKIITLKNLTCYFSESSGQGKRQYKFTDGTKSISVNSYNLSTCVEGSAYDITGIISIKDYSAIIIAFSIDKLTSVATSIDYESIAINLTISELKNIKGPQDDTTTRYDSLTNAFGNFYKTTGYLTAVNENGKLYVGISSTYRDYSITGKNNAKANYDVVLIKNDDFWNTMEDELYLFNPYYDDYLMENNQITVYYVLDQIAYEKGKVMWEILLIPDSIPEQEI